jgi:RNA polymerase sigma-70 factor (ECF subfamily)
MAVRSDIPALGGIGDFSLDDLEQYRRPLTGYCYRMLGSSFEAEDAVQETLVRAWRAIDGFEGRSAVRSWLYRIATNVCLDMLRGRQRRARPMDLGPSGTTANFTGEQHPENTWIEPIPDSRVFGDETDPAELAASKETIRLAFITALQHLPARQRAVLILREVLRWHADEVAELLDTTVASVNSALQRARATMAAHQVNPSATVDADQQELLARYVDAFERYDVSGLVSLLHEDAIQSMPPYLHWLVGADQIGAWMLGPGIDCRGSRMLVAPQANGVPALAQYRPDPNGGHAPWSLLLLDVRDGKIAALNNFLDTKLFAAFGLPAHL